MIFILLLTTTGFANDEYRIVTINELVALEEFQAMDNMSVEQIEDYIKNKWDSNLVLLLKNGTKIPLNLFLKGDYLHLCKNKEELAVLKDVYIKLVKGEFLFSDDLQKWASFFSFFTGGLGVRVIKDEGYAKIELNAEMNRRG